MGKMFAKAGAGLRIMLEAVMKERHTPLFDAGVRVEIILARSSTGHAVTHGGYPALATIKIVPLKDRLTKGYDAEIQIDQFRFEQLAEGKQVGTIDHELQHIQLKKHAYAPVLDDAGKPTDKTKIVNVKLDDLGRPVLVSIKGDWNVGDGFEEVVRRNGLDAVEFVNIAEAKAKADQALKGAAKRR